MKWNKKHSSLQVTYTLDKMVFKAATIEGLRVVSLQI